MSWIMNMRRMRLQVRKELISQEERDQLLRDLSASITGSSEMSEIRRPVIMKPGGEDQG